MAIVKAKTVKPAVSRLTITVRQYDTNGNFIKAVTSKSSASTGKTVKYAQSILALEEKYPREGVAATLPTNIVVRDHTTGRFIKWRNK